MLRSDFSVLLTVCVASLPLMSACPGPGTLDDGADPTDASEGSPSASASVSGLTSTGPSATNATGTTVVDPDGSSTSPGTTDSTGTTGEGIEDLGCPLCIVLADGLGGGRGIAVDLTHVYFTDQDDGSVHRVQKGGGDGGSIAADQDQPYDIVVSDGHVYWTNFALDGAVMSASVDGGPPTVIQDERFPRSIAVVDGQIYWGTFEEDGGAIRQLPVGGVGAPTLRADVLGGVSDLVVDGTDVYFTAHTSSNGGSFIEPPPVGSPIGSVFQTSMGGDPFFPDPLRNDLAEPWGIAKQGDTLFWANGMGMAANEPRSILSMPSVGGLMQTLAVNQAAPWGVAADDQYVYWTDFDTVRAMPIGGGSEILLADVQNRARSIVVDNQWVYWVTSERVLQRPKP